MGKTTKTPIEKKKEAAIVYATSGNMHEVQRQVEGVSAQTVNNWIRRADSEFLELVEKAKKGMDDQFIARVRVLMNKTLDKYAEKLEDKEKMDKAALRDLSQSFAVLFDKKQIAENKPTSIAGKSGQEVVKGLRQQFEEHGKKNMPKPTLQ